MSTNEKIAVTLIFTGIGMFVLAVGAFTSRGISHIYSTIGLISFFAWLPTFLTGLIWLIVATRKKIKAQQKKHGKS